MQNLRVIARLDLYPGISNLVSFIVSFFFFLFSSKFKVFLFSFLSWDFVGAGSTPLHYAACGGIAVCCQVG